ncbi:transposase [Marinomonas sp. A79]|uniref:Transposase n=1 Tax=Marinomonas vulgaris TaxID=2823372 RepID=A0ABS5HCN2_9GAMM|nr:transposase [Marinomonas vulgaris]MBR7889159.1 transposase [Marinomonas vulgaris]
MSWIDLKKGRYSQLGAEYFITFNTQGRFPFFNDHHLAHIFCQQISLNEQHCNCQWLAWVLMPDHFHGLVVLESEVMSLSNVVGALKGASAYRLNDYTGYRRKIWQNSFYDRALRADEDRLNIARYIVANPLRKGLVRSVKNYPFWNSVYL